MRRVSRVLAWGVAVGLCTGLAACSQEDPEVRPTPSATPSSSPSATGPIGLTLGIFGTQDENAVLERLAARFDRRTPEAQVEVQTWPTHDDALRTYRSGRNLPDLFMASLSDLPWLMESELTLPVSELLDERGVSFSETYARDSLQAYASDDGLQCLPYAISPLVIYLNKDLVDFDTMLARGLPVAEDPTRWNWEEFEAAARFAARPRKDRWGAYVAPTLRDLAPFIYAAGGQLFDDPVQPTSLAFGSEDTQTALTTVLELLRDPRVTPSPEQLAGRTSVELFEQGKVGMIVGSRSLTPQLRLIDDFRFDVKPIPSIARSSTIGDVTGVCMAADTASPDLAADLLMEVFSTEAIARIAQQGFLVPADVVVAQSPAFLQPGLEPANAAVFNNAVRSLVLPPHVKDWSALNAAVSADLDLLLNTPILELSELGAKIDTDSRTVLAPPTQSPSPGTPTG